MKTPVKFPKILSKAASVDMTVTTDDLVNIQVAKIEADLLVKQKQYQSEIAALKVIATELKDKISSDAVIAVQAIIDKIPAELSVKISVRSKNTVDVCLASGKAWAALKVDPGTDRGYNPGAYQEVDINQVDLAAALENKSKIDEAISKLQKVGSELGLMENRIRQIRAEISQRKLNLIDGGDLLSDLSSSNNPLLSLPSDL